MARMYPAICKKRKGFLGAWFCFSARFSSPQPLDARLRNASNEINFHTRELKFSFVMIKRLRLGA